MKSIFVVMLIFSSLNASWTDTYVSKQGWKRVVECKIGHMIEVTIGEIDGKSFRLERAYCVDRNGWNQENCNHKPLKCAEGK